MGGESRKETDIDLFFTALGGKKSARIKLAAMDRWKPFRNSVIHNAPNARIIFDKFHIMRHLSKALDEVRRGEYKRLSGKDRSYIKGQRYTLLSRRENLSLDGRRALKKLLRANRRLNTAYILKEAFGQLWDYRTERGARAFFTRWKDSLKWQRLGNTASVHAWIFALDQVVVCMVTTRPPKTIVEPTALGTVANTDSKLLICRLFQKGRVLAQDGVTETKTAPAASSRSTSFAKSERERVSRSTL